MSKGGRIRAGRRAARPRSDYPPPKCLARDKAERPDYPWHAGGCDVCGLGPCTDPDYRDEWKP